MMTIAARRGLSTRRIRDIEKVMEEAGLHGEYAVTFLNVRRGLVVAVVICTQPTQNGTNGQHTDQAIEETTIDSKELRVVPQLKITERRLTILRLIASGVPSKAISGKLAISEATRKREMQIIFDFLGVDDRAHAVAKAFELGLLP